MRYLLKGIRVILAILPGAGLIQASPLEEVPLHVSFTPAQMHGETYLWQIVETPSGQVLAGGDQLLFYGNGRWNAVPGVHKTAIRALLVDGANLWVGSPGEIGRIALPLTPQSKYERVAVPGLAESGEVWQLSKSGAHLVATTKEDVWFLNPDTHQSKRQTLANAGRLMIVSLNGEKIVVQTGRAMWRLAGDRLEPYENPLPDKSDLIWAWADKDYVLTNKSLYRNEAGTFRPAIATKALANKVIVVDVAHWGRVLALATFSQGVILYDTADGSMRVLDRSSGLASQITSGVLSDSAGRLWVGTPQGLVVFESPRFGHLLIDNSYPQFSARFAGLFVSHEDSAIYYRENGKEETYPQRVYEFVPTANGVALGFAGKVRLGETDYAAKGNRIGATIELGDGKLLVTSGENLYLIDPAAGTSTLVPAPQTEFTGLAIIGETLWAAGINGSLYRANVQPPFAFTKVAALAAAGPTKLQRLHTTLITASNAGVRFGEHFQTVAAAGDISNPFLAENADGLWLMADQGGLHRLGRLVETAGNVAWQTVEAKGLNLLTDPHSLNASGHSLLICGGNQILELASDQLKSDYRLDPPRLAFTNPESGTPADLAAPPEKLSADRNSLTFVGSLAFDEFGERPAYERRLLPTETDWIPTKANDSVSYPSLSPRNYTLEVRATHLGRTGAVTSRTFTVLPPWYASPAAFAGYGVFALLSFYSIFRLRTHQIRQRNLELERLVDKRTHELAQASAAKTEFLASMSHEIRNPMNGVIGLVNILREEPLGPRQARTLKMLHGCAEQLRTTVDDILDFSKIEAGRVVLERTTFDLLDTLEASAATIDSSGTRIRFLEPLPPHLSLVGDAGKLRQIFANYASNALKYGIPPEARVNTILVPSEDGVRLTLSVTSSGPTIDKDTLDKFFESFTRGQDAMERNIHGTGLGLAICRRYAQAMGGEVGAVSTNGETTFYLNVPFAKSAAAALEPVAAPAHNALPARALAIEDEDYNRIVLGSILTKMNYSVDWATTGAEALKLAQENGYDIVLTDYRLPDTNGVDLAREILRLCPEPKPAVFAVTAYSTRERRDECMRAGMAGFISKPITLEKLRTTLAGWGDKQLTTISLEASRRPLPPQPPAAIESGWIELKRAAMLDTKRAAELAHRLNNVCRAFNYLDLAEQLELLEGALERNEPAAPFLQACERLLRPSSDDQSS